MIRLDKLLSSLGYCSRKEAKKFIRNNNVLIDGQEPDSPDQKVKYESVTIDGEPCDPPPGIILAMNKPCGYICSHKEDGEIIYSLIPERFNNRNPKITCVGRLDKDTSGLLLLTDDGQVVHKLTSPKHNIVKIYEATLAEDIKGNEKELFASGTLMLEGEEEPLKPAELEVISERHVIVKVSEGRYHQVRRMFAAVGNKVVTLKRTQIGKLVLSDLAEGEYRPIDISEII